MAAWEIIALIVLVIVIIGVWYSRKKVVSTSPSTGVQLRKAAENIPIYGQFVKYAGVVGKPVNSVLDKFTNAQISVLKHIPVVGGTIAKPAEWTEQGVKKLNNWLGL